MNKLTERVLSNSELHELIDEFETDGSHSLPDRCEWLILEVVGETLFTHQTGGFACLHPRTRGRIFTSPELVAALHMIESLLYSRHRGWHVPAGHLFTEDPEGYPGLCIGVNQQDAEDIDKILSPFNIRIDPERASQSMEAWIYVLWNGAKAVITTANSD